MRASASAAVEPHPSRPQHWRPLQRGMRTAGALLQLQRQETRKVEALLLLLQLLGTKTVEALLMMQRQETRTLDALQKLQLKMRTSDRHSAVEVLAHGGAAVHDKVAVEARRREAGRQHFRQLGAAP